MDQAVFFGAGEWMTADKLDASRQPALYLAENGCFGAAGVAQQRTGPTMNRCFNHPVGDAVNWRAEQNEIGIRGSSQVCVNLIHYPILKGLCSRFRLSIDARCARQDR